MAFDSNSRLAIAAILLALQTLLFLFQCGINYLNSIEKWNRMRPYIVLFQYLVFPLFIGAVGIVFTLLMFNSDFDEPRCSVTPKDVDTDIVGPGILIAQWAQLAVLFTFALLGTFHTHATGVKEIGAGLTVIHLALAIALLVQVKLNVEFSRVDAILGAMILDSQGSAVSIQLITKETLASRFQVLAVLPCQIFGLVVEAILVDGFYKNRFNFKLVDCNCISVTWWGRLSSCHVVDQKQSSDQEIVIFWTYFACRVVGFVHSAYHALMDTFKFHDAEKQSRKTSLVNGSGLKHTTFLSTVPASKSDGFNKFLRWVTSEGKRKADYNNHLTTLSLIYFINGVFSVASMAAVKAAIEGGKELEDDKGWSAGQVIAVVVAAVTIVRGIWHFIGIFRNNEKWGVPKVTIRS